MTHNMPYKGITLEAGWHWRGFIEGVELMPQKTQQAPLNPHNFMM
jgi:hypothetical protein